MARQRETLLSSLRAHDDIPHMQDTRQLKAYVRAMWDVARKRINRLGDPNVVGADLVPAGDDKTPVVTKFGKPASSASNDLPTLRREYKRLYNFLTAQTSTPQGYKDWFEKQRRIFNAPTMTATELGALWDAYNKAKEEFKLSRIFYDSGQIAKAIHERVTSTGVSADVGAHTLFAIAKYSLRLGQRLSADDFIKIAQNYDSNFSAHPNENIRERENVEEALRKAGY